MFYLYALLIEALVCNTFPGSTLSAKIETNKNTARYVIPDNTICTHAHAKHNVSCAVHVPVWVAPVYVVIHVDVCYLSCVYTIPSPQQKFKIITYTCLKYTGITSYVARSIFFYCFSTFPFNADIQERYQSAKHIFMIKEHYYGPYSATFL